MKTVLLTLLLLSSFVLFAQDVKPIGENEEINFEFLHNNWEVIKVAFGEATISGENLKKTPHYFTMKMGDWGNFYQSNLEYETATFGHNTNTNTLNITTSKGESLSKHDYKVLRLEKESMVLQNPKTETIYYFAPVPLLFFP